MYCPNSTTRTPRNAPCGSVFVAVVVMACLPFPTYCLDLPNDCVALALF